MNLCAGVYTLFSNGHPLDIFTFLAAKQFTLKLDHLSNVRLGFEKQENRNNNALKLSF